jgi:hypothetical protein
MQWSKPLRFTFQELGLRRYPCCACGGATEKNYFTTISPDSSVGTLLDKIACNHASVICERRLHEGGLEAKISARLSRLERAVTFVNRQTEDQMKTVLIKQAGFRSLAEIVSEIEALRMLHVRGVDAPSYAEWEAVNAAEDARLEALYARENAERRP